MFAFQPFPGMNMPMANDLPLLFTLTGIQAAGEGAQQTAETKYYTVLGVTRDRGIPLMWLASLVMMAGFVCSFYARPRRVWVLAEDGNVFIGGRTRGETGSFLRFIEHALGDHGTVKR